MLRQRLKAIIDDGVQVRWVTNALAMTKDLWESVQANSIVLVSAATADAIKGPTPPMRFRECEETSYF